MFLLLLTFDYCSDTFNNQNQNQNQNQKVNYNTR